VSLPGMGNLVVFENISLDGVTQDPTGEEGFSRADWRAVLSPTDQAAWGKMISDDALDAEALLFGRRSYEFFASRYPARTGALADRINGLPKYVVSSTLTNPDWHNSTVLRGDVVTAVAALKQEIAGEIRLYASTRLAHTLLAHDLVDGVRLAIFPIVLGAGDRLFDPAGAQRMLELVDTRRVGDGLTHLTYRLPARS
jgi:dihydrofolate reductase